MMKPMLIIYHGLVTSECHNFKLYGVKMCAGLFKFGLWNELNLFFFHKNFISFAWIVIVIDFASVIKSILCARILFCLTDSPLHKTIFSISSAFCYNSLAKKKIVGYLVELRFSVYIPISQYELLRRYFFPNLP